MIIFPFIFSKKRLQSKLRKMMTHCPVMEPSCDIVPVVRDKKLYKLLLIDMCVGEGKLTVQHIRRMFDYIAMASKLLKHSVFLKNVVDGVQFRVFYCDGGKKLFLSKMAFWLEELLESNLDSKSILMTALGGRWQGVLEDGTDLQLLEKSEIAALFYDKT